MNVNPTISSIFQANLAKTRQASGLRQHKVEERADMTAPEKVDRVSISSHGSTQLEVGKMVRGILQDIRDYDTNMLPSRVSEISSGIADGSYQVSSEDLADAILGRAFGR